MGAAWQAALSTLMLLGHSKFSSLEETIYAVAAAKFIAEKSEHEGVGPSTAMYVTHKRTASDPTGEPPGAHIQPEEMAALRDAWEKYGKPRIPDQAIPVALDIINKSGIRSRGPSGKSIEAMMRLGAS